MKRYPLKIELLSPVHIGTGKEIEPFEYIIKDGKYHKISLERFLIEASSEIRNRFTEIQEAGNLTKLRRFIVDSVDVERFSIYSTNITSEIEADYQRNLERIENQMRISPFINTSTEKKPYIPGSSFKGSIRTAIINSLVKITKKKILNPARDLENEILGYRRDIKKDPFRAIYIKDMMLDSKIMEIGRVINISNKNGKIQKNNIQMIIEASFSAVSKENSFTYETELTFDDQLFSTNWLSKDISFVDIEKACKDFYFDKLEYEHKKFYNHTEFEEISNRLLNIDFDKNEFPLRLGRFAGVESVTVDGLRNPRPPKGKGWGNTRNVFCGKYPMGWVKVKVLNSSV